MPLALGVPEFFGVVAATSIMACVDGIFGSLDLAAGGNFGSSDLAVDGIFGSTDLAVGGIFGPGDSAVGGIFGSYDLAGVGIFGSGDLAGGGAASDALGFAVATGGFALAASSDSWGFAFAKATTLCIPGGGCFHGYVFGVGIAFWAGGKRGSGGGLLVGGCTILVCKYYTNIPTTIVVYGCHVVDVVVKWTMLVKLALPMFGRFLFYVTNRTHKHNSPFTHNDDHRVCLLSH